MRNYIKRNDIILISAILLISLVFTVILYKGMRNGDRITVYVDSKTVGEYPLESDGTIVIEGYNGGHNTLTVENGYAFMSDASCPDKLCIHQGRISGEGQMIVCLPNRVIIKVTGGKDSGPEGRGEGGYDAITE